MTHFASVIRSANSNICPALALVASLAFTTLVTTAPAIAQEDRAEPTRDTSGGTFPTAESMKIGIAQKVEHGNLSQEQADMILRVHQRLLMGIDSGKLSVNEALGIMEQRAQAIYGDKDKPGTTGQFTEHELVIKLANAVEAGELTPAEAAEFIIATQQKLDAEVAFESYKAEIIAAVRSGDLSREEAGSTLEGFKKNQHEQMMTAMKERMAAAIENGTMTEEQVKKIWAMSKNKSDIDDGEKLSRKDYEQAAAKMIEMVKAGEMTREQMQKKLEAMKKAMGTERTITREDYAKAQAEMQELVDAGKITEDQMNARLNRMRKMIGRSTGGQKAESRGREGVSDDCMELRRKLGEAVRAGEMTREEAGEVWKEEGC